MSSSNFLKSLYSANVIEASIWNLKFDKENKKEGYLIVGENLSKWDRFLLVFYI